MGADFNKLDPYGRPNVVANSPITEIYDGRKVVAAAGVREPLSSTRVVARFVILTAETDNTGVIVVGGETAVAAQATRRGTPLNAGASMGIPCDNLAGIYLDTTVNGDGVTYTYLV